MARFRRFVVIGFIALLVVLPLHEVADPGEQLPFDDEVVAVVFAALFITAASLTCRSWRGEWLVLLQASARRRLSVTQTVTQMVIAAVPPPRDESLARSVLCQFRV